MRVDIRRSFGRKRSRMIFIGMEEDPRLLMITCGATDSLPIGDVFSFLPYFCI